MMDGISGALRARFLKKPQQDALEALLDVFNSVTVRNAMIDDYYEGDVMVKEVGIDVLPPNADVHVSLSCNWPHKAVEALANRSRFDSFVFSDGHVDSGLARIMLENSIRTSYRRRMIGQLKHGCMFATVGSMGGKTGVRFHGANSAAGIWDELHERLGCGFVVANKARTEYSKHVAVPVQVNLHMPGSITVIERSYTNPNDWTARTDSQPNDEPMMVAFRYQPTDNKPLGTGRITKPVRAIVDNVLQVRLALAVNTAFYAIPQRYFLNLTDEMYDTLIESKWATYSGAVLLATADGDLDKNPEYGQLPSNSPQALISIIEHHAKEFAGISSVPLNSLGIVQDNPSSAEAIEAARADLIDLADELNEANAESLRKVALMAMAVESNKAIRDLDETQLGVMANFRDPRMASLAASADAAVKTATADPDFPKTDVFYEMQGYGESTIARIRSQERRAQGSQLATAIIQSRFGDDESI